MTCGKLLKFRGSLQQTSYGNYLPITSTTNNTDAFLCSIQVDRLITGEVGYFAASIKTVADARVGDTITSKKNGATEPLPGYTEAKPMVFCGLFPTDADDFNDLREALGRLQLNDAALSYEPEVQFLQNPLKTSLFSKCDFTTSIDIQPDNLMIQCLSFPRLHVNNVPRNYESEAH